jgi:spore germination cell wall hydrolase CwlJ-like protein
MKILAFILVITLILFMTSIDDSDPPIERIVVTGKVIDLRDNSSETIIENQYTKKDFDCLAKNIFYEAGVESIKGKYAVAQVTLNRVESTRYPNTICGVVYQRAQFSWTLKPQPKPWGKLWEESQQVAYSVLYNDTRLESLQDALFYHATYVKPYWVDRSAKIKQVGQHVFYSQAK